jgi:hypothetical protein
MPEDSLGIEIAGADDLDLDAEAAFQRAADEAGWPLELEKLLQTFRQVKPERAVNATRLGELAFTDAEQQLADIVRVLSDLRSEEWRLVRPDLATQIVGTANGTLDTLRQMAELRLSEPDAQTRHDQYVAQLRTNHQFFIDQVWPICFNARVEDVLKRRRDLLAEGLSDQRVKDLQDTFEKLEAEVEEFKSLSDLVSAQRQLVGKGGVSDLSAHFKALVKESNKEFTKWARCLAAAVVLGGGAAVAWVYFTRPGGDAGNPEIVTHIALDVLVVGLVVFLIRFFAIQTRAHRHVEIVSRNKVKKRCRTPFGVKGDSYQLCDHALMAARVSRP